MMAYYNKCYQILVGVRLTILFSEKIDITSMNVKEKKEKIVISFSNNVSNI